MKINIYPIVSPLHEKSIEDITNSFLSRLAEEGGDDFRLCELSHLYDGDIALVLVQSGGSEAKFLEILPKLQSPIYLLTHGTNNSLAASMEILSYLNNHEIPAMILHGKESSIIAEIHRIHSHTVTSTVNLGVIGKPSDWLISSDVNHEHVLQKMNVKLIDISMDELISDYHKSENELLSTDVFLDYNQTELKKAKQVYYAMNQLIHKYQLSGLTIRCFDLLDTIHTTGCLGLSLLNQRGIIGTCEGDIPSMLSMYCMNQIVGQSGFQANPSKIEGSRITFAHCTVPLNMVEKYHLTTHFESGIGVAIKGEMLLGDVTIFKLSSDLSRYYVEEGKLIENLNRNDLCRTQIVVELPSTQYFLHRSLGNHHIILYGHHKKTIEDQIHRYLK